jgi:hypothetical protein
MLDHHLQRAIVYRLAFVPTARFSDLKPDDIENKLFTYHLQKVITAGYVTKTDAGLYSLTPAGRRLGFAAIKSEKFLLEKAYSVLFLVVRRHTDKSWLTYTRHTHPMLDQTVLPQADPSIKDEAPLAAAKQLLENTGLKGTFRALGSGYFRIYHEDDLESFTNFTLLVCEDAEGEIVQNDINAHYEWLPASAFPDAHTPPSTKLLIELYQAGKPFFHEATFRL